MGQKLWISKSTYREKNDTQTIYEQHDLGEIEEGMRTGEKTTVVTRKGI